MSDMSGDPLDPITTHMASVREIAESEAPDAHIHRILTSLAEGEQPDEADLKQLIEENDG